MFVPISWCSSIPDLLFVATGIPSVAEQALALLDKCGEEVVNGDSSSSSSGGGGGVVNEGGGSVEAEEQDGAGQDADAGGGGGTAGLDKNMQQRWWPLLTQVKQNNTSTNP